MTIGSRVKSTKRLIGAADPRMVLEPGLTGQIIDYSYGRYLVKLDSSPHSEFETLTCLEDFLDFFWEEL